MEAKKRINKETIEAVKKWLQPANCNGAILSPYGEVHKQLYLGGIYPMAYIIDDEVDTFLSHKIISFFQSLAGMDCIELWQILETSSCTGFYFSTTTPSAIMSLLERISKKYNLYSLYYNCKTRSASYNRAIGGWRECFPDGLIWYLGRM